MLGTNRPIYQWTEDDYIPQLGGSDAHHLQQIGLVKTEIFGPIKNWHDVVQAIKNNQTRPFTDVSLEELQRNSFREPVYKTAVKERFPKISKIFY